MSKRLPEGISLRHVPSRPSRSGDRCRCTPRYQAQALEPARSQAPHSHLPDACGGQELALRRARRPPTRHPACRWRCHPQPGCRRVAQRRAGGSRAQPIRRSLQAVRPARLRAVAACPAPPRARRRKAQRHPPLGRSAARQSDDERRPWREHCPQLVDAAASDLPAGARARRGCRQPDKRRPAPRRPRQAGADRFTDRGRAAHRRPPAA